ncbi:MAG: NB-ARC domain-containing protein, partial [Chloroflexota bacterium]
MQTTVFLSYARKDDYLDTVTSDEEHTYHLDPARSFTRQLHTALTAAGLTVWWDRESMPNRGLTFLDEIRQAVHDCDVLVYIAGENAAESDYVRAEWQYAQKNCKPIIPVLRNGDYPIIPAEISMGNAPDMRNMDYFNQKVEELVRLLTDQPRIATLYSVPLLPDWYIERGSDVHDLQAALRADALAPVVVTSRQQTLTLQGMGGLGKSTMAAALCRLCDVRYSFADGVFWIELGKHPSIATRQADIGSTFGDVRDEYRDEQRGKARLSHILKDRAALIVLDDVWDYRHVEAFRVNAPQSRILVTTRIGRISTQLGVDNHEIDTLTVDEGIALLGKRLGRAPDADNPHRDDEAAIVDMLGGHTLAISIAAARISEKGADYVPRFRERLKRRRAKGDNPLGELNMQANDKNYNLELSLSESYDDLPPEQQTQFRALGAFAPDSTFDLTAAQAVWSLEDEYDAEDALDQFVRLSLLTQPEPGRYEQHGLLRDYACGLSAADELLTHQRRHFDHYHSIHGDHDRNNDEDRHDLIASDWANCLAALHWGLDHEAEKAVDWTYALHYFMQFRRSSQERLDLLTRALESARAISYPRGEANTLHALGEVHLHKNEYEAAVGRYQDALPLYTAIGNRLGQANTLKALGDVHRMKNEYEAAVGRYQAALPLYAAIGARLGQAHTLQALGDVHRMKNEYEAAVGR